MYQDLNFTKSYNVPIPTFIFTNFSFLFFNIIIMCKLVSRHDFIGFICIWFLWTSLHHHIMVFSLYLFLSMCNYFEASFSQQQILLRHHSSIFQMYLCLWFQSLTRPIMYKTQNWNKQYKRKIVVMTL